MIKQPNYSYIINNYVNGNISDCRELIKKLSHWQLLKLVQEWSCETGCTLDECIEQIKSLTVQYDK